MTDPGNLSRYGKRQLAAITASCPELAEVQAHVQAFAQIMTRAPRPRDGAMVNAASGQPELQSFIAGPCRDQDTVTAGLSQPQNSGSAEGHINRTKMLKRQITAAPAPTCSAAASSSPTNDQGSTSQNRNQWQSQISLAVDNEHRNLR